MSTPRIGQDASDLREPSWTGERTGDEPALEESCLYPRHTLAGIEERATCLTGPYGSMATWREYRLDMLRDAVATLLPRGW